MARAPAGPVPHHRPRRGIAPTRASSAPRAPDASSAPTPHARGRGTPPAPARPLPVSYTHLRAHETRRHL
eukprot:12493482-Prorocentrum_lima.AAC.1